MIYEMQPHNHKIQKPSPLVIWNLGKTAVDCSNDCSIHRTTVLIQNFGCMIDCMIDKAVCHTQDINSSSLPWNSTVSEFVLNV